MLDFNYIKLKDITEIGPYFEYSTNRACDNTIGGTFMWREYFETQYALWEETMILKVNYIDGATAFTFPLGKNIEGALKALEDYCRQQGIPLILCTITEETKEYLEKRYSVTCRPERNWFDYLYRMEDLYHLEGRRYSGQRNHINYFKKNHPDYSFEVITEENVSQVKEFYERLPLIDSKSSELFAVEQNKVFEVLNNFKTYGMFGGFIRIPGEMISFALGEIVKDTLYVHIEKANTGHRGAYQIIVNEFVRHFAGPDINFVNREDDAGDEGLRTSKNSYHPCGMVEKYTVFVNI